MICGVNCNRRRNSDLIWIGVEESTPPPKRTWNYNIMLAHGHKLHITETVFALIPVNKLDGVLTYVKAE